MPTSSFASYNNSDPADVRRCEQCTRPRDNNHETLCPICLLIGSATTGEEPMV